MAKRIFSRGISLLLALITVLLCVSCTTGGGTEEQTGVLQRLTVEKNEISYSDAFMKKSAERAAEIFARLVRSKRGLVFNEEQKSSLINTLLEKYIPLFQGEGIREDKLEQILSEAERLCAELEAEDALDENVQDNAEALAFCSFYRRFVAAAGSEAAGRVTYEIFCRYFEDRAEYYEARYEEYGYLWYNDSAKTVKSRLDALRTDVGKEVFSDAMDVIVFSVSVAAGVVPMSDGAESSLLYDGDVSAVIVKQSEYFLSMGITEYQWYVIGNALSLIASDDADTLKGAMAAELRDGGFFGQGARCIPKLLTLYAAFAKKMNSERIAQMRSDGTRETRVRIMCQALSECPDELSALLSAIEENCLSKSDACYKLISNSGKEDEFNSFCAEYSTIGSQELIETIVSCAEGNMAADGVERDVVRYAATIAPYFTYAIYADGAAD